MAFLPDLGPYVDGGRRDAWQETDSQDNAAATATHAAETGKRHVITAVSASFSASSTKLLQIKDDTTVIWEAYVENHEHLTFPTGLLATAGNAVSAVLAASGGAGTIGKVNIAGYTTE